MVAQAEAINGKDSGSKKIKTKNQLRRLKAKQKKAVNVRLLLQSCGQRLT